MAITTDPARAGRAAHAAATYVLDVPEPVKYHRTMATASNYDTYVIDAGRYPVELINLNGTPWDPNPDTHTPGYLANNGPYYAKVTVKATRTHTHIVNRLLTASSAEDTYPNEPTTVTESVYAYLLKDGASGPFTGSTFREQTS